jgi:RNA-dependent RNA polymerase
MELNITRHTRHMIVYLPLTMRMHAARVAPYAHHLRVLLANREDLLKFQQLCHIAQGNFRPVRVSYVNSFPQDFFSNGVQPMRWIQTMDCKNDFQIEAYLRCGLLNTHGLLFSLQKPIESVIRD